MLQSINYTKDELGAMVLVNKSKNEKSAPVLFFDGKPVHEIVGETPLPGESFRKVRHRYAPDIELEASNLGRIRFNGKVLLQHEKDDDSNGYLVVDVPNAYPILVYQIVADAWLEEAKDSAGMEIHHITNNGYDNRPQNLIFVTKDEHQKIHQ